jgi:aerobic-type carbon monoxide dehydrogenase small subunit (CoxS/CutS family)
LGKAERYIKCNGKKIVDIHGMKRGMKLEEVKKDWLEEGSIVCNIVTAL